MLEVTHEGKTVVDLNGNSCKYGAEYAECEIIDPRRMVTTTVRIKGGIYPLIPVYTEFPFPKPQIFELLAKLRQLELEAPVKGRYVVLENALGSGINVVTSRHMPTKV